MSSQIVPQQIDWTAGQLRPAPRKCDPLRREMFYPVRCRCNSVRWLRRCDAIRTSMCARCQRVVAGRAGRAATVKRHGAGFALPHIAEYQHKFPSVPEKRVRQWLTAWGIPFQDSVIFQRWVVDLVVDQRAIEVVGYWHKSKRIERDQVWAAAWGGPVLFLDADEVTRRPDCAQDKLQKFLNEVSNEPDQAIFSVVKR